MPQLDNYPLVSWEEVNGNPFVRKISPLMLDESGFSEIRCVTLKNAEKHTERSVYRVTYTRDYVIRKIVNDLLRPLAIQDYNTFQKLISECWKAWKEEAN